MDYLNEKINDLGKFVQFISILNGNYFQGNKSTGTISRKIQQKKAFRNHVLDSVCSVTLMIPEMIYVRCYKTSKKFQRNRNASMRFSRI